ncbi:uncharacterized protein DUF3592 [Humitalea rosea]|uniref:Uncharacterized protein DUF3592 n=1 Tax=Humitalea rosea TaxID=990373 RepID=A0A2W7ITA5_9PROT|nr:DUF3592 domain-containing protein [Humitalea rosea]PZW51031.1 uncharacterized protein DUF3592 [Humitalea rosea]
MAARRLVLAIGVLFALVGAGLGYAAWSLSADTRDFLTRAVPAEGEVVRLDTLRTRRNRSGNAFPVFRWTDAAGQTHEARSNTATAFDNWAIGDKVRLMTDPATVPPRAEVAGTWGDWIGTVVLGTVAALFLLVGAALCLARPAR